jgi:hypothetical protein
MTAFILLHTTLSVLPIGFGLYAFARRGAIDPATRSGKWYLGTMLASSVTGFGFLFTIGFTPGTVLTLFTLMLLLAATYTLKGARRPAGYVQSAALTTSFLMLMVFATTETLKKFPLGEPFAANAADPALIPVRLALMGTYLAVLGSQVLSIRSGRQSAPRLAAAAA